MLCERKRRAKRASKQASVWRIYWVLWRADDARGDADERSSRTSPRCTSKMRYNIPCNNSNSFSPFTDFFLFLLLLFTPVRLLFLFPPRSLYVCVVQPRRHDDEYLYCRSIGGHICGGGGVYRRSIRALLRRRLTCSVFMFGDLLCKEIRMISYVTVLFITYYIHTM